MADLDDFFAKKDKKKPKTKKFLTAEELAKQLEDTSKRPEPQKTKKERPASSAGGGEGDDSSNSDQRHDDEWKEFEEEERKDYSGLKLAQLTLSEDHQHNSGHDGDGGHDGSSDGEGNTVSSDRRHHGPWKKVDDSNQPQVQPEPEPQQPPPVLQKSSKYISPAFRGQMGGQRPIKLRNKDAPDITNEEYFPTLGAARPEEQRKKKNEPAFEEVRHGSRITRIQEVQQSAPVSVGNRFRSLADDDS